MGVSGRIVRFVNVLVFAAMVLGHGATASAQQGRVTGTVVQASTGAPVENASVTVEETGQRTKSRADGTFTFQSLASGEYHIGISAPKFASQRLEVTVPAGTLAPVSVEFRLESELHYTEVVSVSPEARDQFDSYQATSVLAGQDLAITLEGSIGSALQSQPGMAQRSFGPGPSRPVIRGLDGDRVLILEDGQRTGDLSSQSGDHGVNINPAAASRLEVVRGPATLLYGANAIGGLVNVIQETIPTHPVTGTSGSAQFDVASNNGDAGAAADIIVGNRQVAFRAGGSGRRTGDMDTPEGRVANTQSRGVFGDVGLSWTSDHSYVGASYAYDDTRYGIPFVEEGQVELTPRRHSLNLRTELRDLGGALTSVRGSYALRRYRHDEVTGGEIGTSFRNDSSEFELLANHRQIGRVKGTFGGWGLLRAFESSGEEALSPPVDQHAVALFMYEEVTWPHATMQFGGRFDRASFAPGGGLPGRRFDNFSGSVGLLYRPTDATTIAVNVARAARNPALEELYFFGPHPGNFSFEIGNPDLQSEKALGVDVSFRWRRPRFSGEITAYRNDIADYVFRNPVDEAEVARRFGSEVVADAEFPFIEFMGADSVLQGLELHADTQLADRWFAEFGVDYVRGSLKDTGAPLPRIPPFRFRGGLRYQRNALQLGADITGVARQDRVFDLETPTSGYGLLKLFGAYSFQSGKALSTITVRLDNATNELYRNHLSFVKDYVPEMGRNFKVVYGVKF